MTGAAPAAASVRLDRPAGYFPRGTSLGFVGLVGLLVGVPFIGLECAAPFVAGGFDGWLGAVPYAAGFGIVVSLAVVFSMATHRYWSVCLFYYLGWALVGLYGVTVLFAVAAVGGVFAVREAGLGAMPVVGLVILGFLRVGAWFLVRALRLRYWRPGTVAGDWEVAGERVPGWALSRRR